MESASGDWSESDNEFSVNFGDQELILSPKNTYIYIDDSFPDMTAILHLMPDGTRYLGFGQEAIDGATTLIAKGYKAFHSTEMSHEMQDAMREYFWNWIRNDINEDLEHFDE